MKKSNYNNNINIIPVVSYSNADKDKFIIYKENKNKSGIYCWNNLITGKSYIGASISLRNRFGHYYSLIFLKKKIEKGSSIIYNSLLKYGHSNFSLDILEYCEPNVLMKREQYYIDVLKPAYNILKTTGSKKS
jgi:group I intron endonuclease